MSMGFKEGSRHICRQAGGICWGRRSVEILLSVQKIGGRTDIAEMGLRVRRLAFVVPWLFRKFVTGNTFFLLRRVPRIEVFMPPQCYLKC